MPGGGMSIGPNSRERVGGVLVMLLGCGGREGGHGMGKETALGSSRARGGTNPRGNPRCMARVTMSKAGVEGVSSVACSFWGKGEWY